MDLELLRDRMEHLRAQEKADFEVLEAMVGTVQAVEASAAAINADRKQMGLLGTFDVDGPRHPEIEAEFPHVPQEMIVRVHEIREAALRAQNQAGSSRRARIEAEEAYRQKELELIELSAASARDDVTHWDRRFHISLAIGHGAAFAAIVNHAFDKDTSRVAIQAATGPLIVFAAGLILSGAIPWVLATPLSPASAVEAFRAANASRARARRLAKTSAGLFVAGLIASLFGVIFLGWLTADKKEAGDIASKPAPATQTTAVSPPTSPSAPVATSPRPSPPHETPAPPPRKSEPQGVASPPAADRKADRG